MKIKITLLIIGIFLFACSNKKVSNKIEPIDKKVNVISQTIETTEETEYYKKLESKVKWFKHGVQKQNSLDKLPQDFYDFYTKFITDSIFQKNNIFFERFIGQSADCEETIYFNDLNWRFSNWDFINFFSNGSDTEPIENWNNTVYISHDRIFFEYEIKEVGVIYQLGFEKIDNQWKLTFYLDDAC